MPPLSRMVRNPSFPRRLDLLKATTAQRLTQTASPQS
jgi:hypothetical protein